MMPIPKVLEKWSVLVVDDEEDSLDVASRLLRIAGAQVYMATNGVEALALIRKYRPDFVLSDLSMPEMDGWQLMHTLNNDRTTAHIPVIALTAHAMTGDRERALAAGFVNHITKPLDVDKFIQHLLNILTELPQFSGENGVSKESL
jgi:CheY-like chemotaxis protein